MSAATKKPPSGPASGRRPSTDPAVTSTASAPSRAPTRSPVPASATANGVARSRSVRTGPPMSARAAMQRPGAGASNLSSSNLASDVDDDARAETAAVLDDLKEQLRKTESASEQFQKQTQVLQSRLDEALQEQGKLEDKLHENEERLELLENEKRDALRQKREMESIYEAERSAMTKEREESANREEEMQTIIQRLKDSLNARSSVDEEGRISRRSNNSSPIDSQFAPTSGLNRSDSRNNSKLLLQKDRLIESLRLELAEAQIKMMESENMGGGRMQEVERLLLEARMTNARLMEDNESYQLLLSEKTLTGDFAKSEFMGSASHNVDALSALEGRAAPASLADELSSAGEDESDSYRRLESELKSAKDSNKALTLYINKIIERLLQHQDFEAILDQSSDFKPGAAGSSNNGKDLPPPPPPKEQASGESILQRAKSVAMGGSRRPRPQSVMQPPSSALTDPDTAPSIPFGRSASYRSGRPKSEQFTAGAANVVNQMYRGGAASPPLHGPQTPRHSQSFFAPPAAGANPNAVHRMPNTGQVPTTGNFPGTSMKSERSSSIGGSTSESGEVSTPPGNSPPRAEKATTFAGNKPRPLRLVQDHPENRKVSGEDDKASKRASWMGWASSAFSKKEESHVDQSIQE
ncbi:m serotype protein [Drepanopeziza brunnea f. sp. 'multigermtubi' MB_m1]|uniref:M serotype protein n=2 Tax=Drepanopeziza brunnea f. sp. 'multigermtubi' TaxID=698441 RepID=K1W7C0_MARBU|nr:m serotype protein [Drepanopeziza brunnea f. sp. 'multigermtubi' MB_m1]EKD12965.1 m serotype protein [Drepanopeziza brunnea f. sp. 'multigermtubi' MB_m1]